MEIGLVGLGRMGSGIARRLMRAGHVVVGFDTDPAKVEPLVGEGLREGGSLSTLVRWLPQPRVVWLALPAGDCTERAIHELGHDLGPGDTIVDGGNSFFRDTQRRHQQLRELGIHLVDVGVSGGIRGQTHGFCLMVGGDEEAVLPLIPLFQALAPQPHVGWSHLGPPGAGHFVKMVHNGIEYALMQAYAEGFQILRSVPPFPLDLAQIAHLWRFGSVIRSWLLDLVEEVLSEDQDLRGLKGWVEDSGEGRWLVKECIDAGVPTQAIAQALQSRFASRDTEAFAHKLMAALRRAFGGHSVVPADPGP